MPLTSFLPCIPNYPIFFTLILFLWAWTRCEMLVFFLRPYIFDIFGGKARKIFFERKKGEINLSIFPFRIIKRGKSSFVRAFLSPRLCKMSGKTIHCFPAGENLHAKNRINLPPNGIFVDWIGSCIFLLKWNSCTLSNTDGTFCLGALHFFLFYIRNTYSEK